MYIKTNKNQKKEVLAVAYLVAIVQPLMVIPQILQIFNNHSAGDVSLLTWVMLILFNTVNFVYGAVYNIKPLVINNLLWVIVDTLVVFGIMLYR
ncbi:MAG TPA: PQ-loop domain-containing transporter [Candidatus Saccharimonadales bacterium]|nr:PQ-loop domain-containing transporter [Candidatus Saccharimonadales bacterium]